MPAFWLALGPLLMALVGSIVGKVLISLGLSVVYYRGVSVALDWVQVRVFNEIGALPAVAQQVIGILQIGTAIKVMFMFWMIRVTLLGLNSDGFKKLVLTGGPT